MRQDRKVEGNMLCNECLRREKCTKLCPEAELYVNQDASKKGLNRNLAFSLMEKQILHRLLEGKTRKEICQLLKITPQSLRNYVKNLKKKRWSVPL